MSCHWLKHELTIARPSQQPEVNNYKTTTIGLGLQLIYRKGLGLVHLGTPLADHYFQDLAVARDALKGNDSSLFSTWPLKHNPRFQTFAAGVLVTLQIIRQTTQKLEGFLPSNRHHYGAKL